MKIKSAVIDITPLLQSHTIRSRHNKVPVQPAFTLEANIIVLQTTGAADLALVNIDTVFSSDCLESRIRDYIGANAVQLLTIATHTHNAPVLSPLFLDGAIFDEAVLDSTARRIADGLLKLESEAFVSVDLSRGNTDAPGSVYRRKNTWTYMGRHWPMFSKTCSMVADRSHSVPSQLSVFSARDKTGKLLFLIWSWPCHATADSDENTIAADFPGTVRTVLRSRSANSARVPIIYLAGLCGDIRPDSSSYFSFDGERVYRPFARQFIYRSARWTRRFATRVAERAVAAMLSAKAISTNATCELRIRTIPVTALVDGETNATLKLVRLTNGEFDLLLFSAEVCCGYTDLLRDSVTPTTLCTGLAGQVYGYLPTDKQISQGGYEVVRFAESFALHGQYKPSVQDIVVKQVSALYTD